MLLELGSIGCLRPCRRVAADFTLETYCDVMCIRAQSHKPAWKPNCLYISFSAAATKKLLIKRHEPPCHPVKSSWRINQEACFEETWTAQAIYHRYGQVLEFGLADRYSWTSPGQVFVEGDTPLGGLWCSVYLIIYLFLTLRVHRRPHRKISLGVSQGNLSEGRCSLVRKTKTAELLVK